MFKEYFVFVYKNKIEYIVSAEYLLFSAGYVHDWFLKVVLFFWKFPTTLFNFQVILTVRLINWIMNKWRQILPFQDIPSYSGKRQSRLVLTLLTVIPVPVASAELAPKDCNPQLNAEHVTINVHRWFDSSCMSIQYLDQMDRDYVEMTL